MSPIEIAIEEWYDDLSITMPLHEYLAMTEAQYGRWLSTKELPEGNPFAEAGDQT